MFPIKTFICFGLVLALAGVVCADETNSESTSESAPPTDYRSYDSRSFATEIRPGEGKGWEQPHRVLVSVGTNDFGILAPHAYRITTSSDKVTMVPNQGSFFLSFRMLVRQTSDANEMAVARRYLASEYPHAKIVEEYGKVAAGNSGPAFSLRGRLDGKVDRILRVALIPCKTGVLEFTVNSEPAKAGEAEAAFNALLRSFRSNERGKFDVVVRQLDKS